MRVFGALILGLTAAWLFPGCHDPAAEQWAKTELIQSTTHRMETYYRKCDSAMILPLILNLHSTGMLNDPKRFNFTAGFFSRVFIRNPDRLEHWFTRILKFPVADQMVFITALRWANTKETRAVFKYYQENVKTDGIAVFCRSIQSVAIPNLMRRPLGSVEHIDAARGAFCGGAEESFFLAVLSTAVNYDREGRPGHFSDAAREALMLWLRRDVVIRKLVNDSRANADERQRKVIDDMLKSNVIFSSENS